jgi:hypothetical protein
MHRRIFMVIVLILMALCGNPGGHTAAQVNDPAPLYVWRVYLRSADDITTLTSGEWDVLESRGADYLRVLGDDSVAQRLSALGFIVEVDEVIPAPAARAPLTYYSGYHSVTEHEQHINSVASAHPELAKSVDYGASWRQQQGLSSGHTLMALCITHQRPGDCQPNVSTDKARFLLISGVHARELVPPEITWRWIDTLISQDGQNADITALLNESEVWVIPVANPDGRTIVESGGNSPLMQRKNADTTWGACSIPYIGVDLNRNAAIGWGGSYASAVPCNELYRGPSADSEPETLAIESLLSQLFPDQRAASPSAAAPLTSTGLVLNLHSDGNLSMLPWDYTNAHSPNDAQLRAVAFRLSYYNGYTTGQSGEVLYLSSGTWEDWIYGQLGIASMLFEIGSSFMPAYSVIDSSYWPLNRDAILYAAKVARQPYTLALGPSTVSPALSAASTAQGQAVTVTAWIDDQRYGNVGTGRPTPVNISDAEYSVDIPPWQGAVTYPMRAADGAFNATREQAIVTLNTAALALNPGRHTLYVRGRNARGNWGPTTAVWLDITAPPVYLLSGVVQDRITHAPLAATLILSSALAGSDIVSMTTTNAAGAYTFTLSGSLTYTLTVEAHQTDAQPDYRAETRSGQALYANQRQDFALLPTSFGYAAYAPVVMRPANAPTPVTYQWLDALTGGSVVAAGDDVSQAVTLPFAFTFYGNVYTRTYVSSNGFVSFGAGSTVYTPTCLPSAAPPNNAIYALWSDLYPTGGANGNVYVKATDSDTFVIQWNHVKRYNQALYETFEIVLRHDNTILLQYQALSSVAYTSTVGIENATGTLAQQAWCKGSGTAPANSTALIFIPSP